MSAKAAEVVPGSLDAAAVSPSPQHAPSALVVEGGGMRGAYAAGVLMGLRAAGRSFDAVYASSSGACSAAYLVTNQPEGLGIWQDHLHGSRLLRARNLLVGKPFLDLEYLVDDVFARRVPLDLTALRNAPVPLVVPLTDAKTGEAVYVDLRRVDSPLEVLRAAAALPIAHPAPVPWNGGLFIDGGIADPIPIERAIADGARRITAVLTRPRGYVRQPENRWAVAMGSRPNPGARNAIQSVHIRYNRALRLARDPPPGVTVDVIAPPASLAISRLTRKRDRLLEAVARGLADAGGASPPTAAAAL